MSNKKRFAAAFGALILALSLSLLSANCWRVRKRTLYDLGSWHSTKTDAEKPLLGAQAFIMTPVTLRSGVLNLGAWHGHQEVWYRPLRAAAVEIRLRLEPQAYLGLLWRSKPEDAVTSGLVLGGPLAPFHTQVTLDRAYVFQSAAPLPFPPLTPGVWHTLKVKFTSRPEESWLNLDGRDYPLNGRPAGLQFVGLRGSAARTEINRVTFYRAGKVAAREDFSNWPAFWRGLAVSLPLAGLGAAAVAVLLAGSSPLRLKVWGLLGVFWGAALLSVFNIGAYLDAAWYPTSPDLINWHAAQPAIEAKDAVVKRVRAQLLSAQTHPGLRVLFLGTSQTWGCGASTDAHTWISLLSEKMRDLFPQAGLSVINAGISGSDSSELLRLANSEWLPLRPDLLVVNLGHNDKDPGLLETNLREFARLAQAAGAASVFVQEADSPEYNLDSLFDKHARMAQVAKEFSIPIVPLHRCMHDLFWRGWLWWDVVHMTDGGQAFAAECLQAGLADAIRRRLENTH